MSINPRIFGAVLVGAGLIGTAYFFAPHTTPTPSQDPTLAIVSATAPDRDYIVIEDNDNDGIPDWKEEFRQSEPVRVVQTDPDEGATYALPDTLTGQLAIGLFTDTVRSDGYGSFGQSQEQMLNGATTQITTAGRDTLYTQRDIILSANNSAATLHAYGNKIVEILLIHPLPSGTRSELEIVQEAVYSSNIDTLSELDPIITSYTSIRDDMLKTPVPSSVAKEHLDLLNVYNAMLIDIEGMRKAFEDPLYAMVRIKRYLDDAAGLNNALVNLYTNLNTQGVQWDDSDLVPQVMSITER